MKPAEQYTQYDETAKASYLYIDQTKVLISFDTVKVAEVKAQYVKDESLGGAMFWMAGMDEEGPNSRVSKVSIYIFVLRSSASISHLILKLQSCNQTNSNILRLLSLR